MRKLKDIKGEEALEVIADLIEPMAEIFSDRDLTKMLKSEEINKAQVISKMIKAHKASVLKVMAVIDGAEDQEAYMANVSILTLPGTLLSVLNDPDVMSLFTSQGQMME